jgi:hypothetical protein
VTGDGESSKISGVPKRHRRLTREPRRDAKLYESNKRVDIIYTSEETARERVRALALFYIKSRQRDGPSWRENAGKK